MAEARIYSYRMTYFAGTAPCVDNGTLTLAICKRDMRRVIGNLFHEKNAPPIWFIGIVGTGLADRADFKAAHRNAGLQMPEAGDPFYIAKVTDVMLFEDYFADGLKNRSDKIYVPADEENGPFWGVNASGSTMYFQHRKGCATHDTAELQCRDWDWDYAKGVTPTKEGAQQNRKHYVLFSTEFTFLSKGEGEKIKGAFGDRLASGVGHQWFTLSEEGQVYRLFDDPARLCCDPHGKGNVPKELLGPNGKSCGKDKA